MDLVKIDEFAKIRPADESVADFLERERAGVAQDQLLLGKRTPFRKN